MSDLVAAVGDELVGRDKTFSLGQFTGATSGAAGSFLAPGSWANVRQFIPRLRFFFFFFFLKWRLARAN